MNFEVEIGLLLNDYPKGAGSGAARRGASPGDLIYKS